MKRFLSFICIFLLIASTSATAFASILPSPMRILSPPVWMAPDALIDNENIPVASGTAMKSMQEMYTLEQIAGGQKFTNLVDGYSVRIPYDMKVDMSQSSICATLEDSYRKIRIFKEVFDTDSERLSYLKYSNRFTENTADHKIIKQESYSVGNYEYHILEWSRKKLSRIKNDKNYYACVDVCIGARVYTFFFASSSQLFANNGYMDIVSSLTTFDPVIAQTNAYNSGYKKSSVARLNPTAKATYEKLFADDATFKMGMFPPDKYGGIQRMEEFEEKLGYKFCAFLTYTEFTDKAGLNAVNYLEKINTYIKKVEGSFKYAQKSGKALELTLQVPLSRKTDKNMIYEILDGEYDQFINAYTKLVASYPYVTVLFRPFNEMNGDWCNYSAFHTSRDPQLYVELYRYLYDKFKAAGCNNTIWIWNPNEISFPNYKWNSEFLYYPGDEYVDVYGITGYNTGTYYEGESWRSFDEIYAPVYERALLINEKPMMITEFSCSSVGGDKVKWIEDMFLSLPKYDKIKVGIWWHAADYNGEFIARPYFMDTPDGTMSVFDKYIN